MTTHNLGQARRLGDEILFISAGRLVEHAPVERFFAQPSTARSRGLHQRRVAMELRRQLRAHRVSAARARLAPSALAQRFITVASTTSTEQSGLFKHLLPIFEKKTGIQVRVVALGTGQALDLARRGDADVVFVHARSAEEEFVREGHGVKRLPVMYNDFVLDRAEIGSGRDRRRQRHARSVAQDQERERAVRVARRPQRHAHRRARICGRWPASTSRRRKARGIARRGKAWAPR